MSARAGELVSLTLAMTCALSCTPDARLQWVVEFEDDALRDRAVLVLGTLQAAGCGGLTVRESRATRSEVVDMSSDLRPGRYGFAAAAFDAECARIGTGCVEVELPATDVEVVTLVSATPRLACDGVCLEGTCDPTRPDAGASDADSDTTVDAEADAPSCDPPCGECGECDSSGACQARPDGETCSLGMCVAGGCCPGCARDGECLAGNTLDACGIGGGACGTCPCADDRCEVGRCRPEQPTFDVAVLSYSACALVGDPATTYCWGENTNGQLGLSEEVEGVLVPTAVPGPVLARIAGGRQHVLALTADGEAFVWGNNLHAELGFADMAVGSVLYAPTAQPMLTPSSVLTTGTDSSSGCALDGSRLRCFGRNRDGEARPGIGATSLPPARIAVPVSVDGGADAADSGADAGAETGWTQVAIAFGHACGVAETGDLYCWGGNRSGQLGVPGTLGDRHVPVTLVNDRLSWASVNVGHSHTCAITAREGDLYCWGGNSNGQIGESPVVPLSASLRQVGLDGDWAQVSGSRRASCATRDDGSMYCWGSSTLLGIGPIPDTNRHLPQQVPGTWSQVDMGVDSACAIDELGALFCWGDGSEGALGLGDTEDRDVPTRVCF